MSGVGKYPTRRRKFRLKPRAFKVPRFHPLGIKPYKCPVPFCGRRFDTSEAAHRHAVARAAYERRLGPALIDMSHHNWLKARKG